MPRAGAITNSTLVSYQAVPGTSVHIWGETKLCISYHTNPTTGIDHKQPTHPFAPRASYSSAAMSRRQTANPAAPGEGHNTKHSNPSRGRFICRDVKSEARNNWWASDRVTTRTSPRHISTMHQWQWHMQRRSNSNNNNKHGSESPTIQIPTDGMSEFGTCPTAMPPNADNPPPMSRPKTAGAGARPYPAALAGRTEPASVSAISTDCLL